MAKEVSKERKGCVNSQSQDKKQKGGNVLKLKSVVTHWANLKATGDYRISPMPMKLSIPGWRNADDGDESYQCILKMSDTIENEKD